MLGRERSLAVCGHPSSRSGGCFNRSRYVHVVFICRPRDLAFRYEQGPTAYVEKKQP